MFKRSDVQHPTFGIGAEDAYLTLFRPTLRWTGFAGRLLCDLLSLPGRLRSLISFFDRLGLGHVLALLGRPVKVRSFPVVHMRISVNPHQTMATAWCRRVSCCLSARALCRGTAHSSWTGCRRTFRLEQVAKREFGRRRCCGGSLGWVTRRRRLGWRSLRFFASAFCCGCARG